MATSGSSALPTRPPESIVGRDSELRAVDEILADGFAVVLRGRAGTGKTSVLDRVLMSTARPGDAVSLVASDLSGTVPLGAFLPLTDAEGPSAPEDLFHTARRLRSRLAATSVLTVDDAHLLDSASAGLVHQLVSDGLPVVLAARTGEPLPPALDALWVSGRLRVLDIEPFDELGTALLIRAQLGGVVDPGVVRAVFEASEGNALYVRELVRSAVESGAVVPRRGVWVLAGALTVPENVGVLLHDQLAALPTRARYAVELVALADVLPVQVVVRLAGHDAIEEAEALGFLRFESRPSEQLRLGHPLYHDAVTGSLSALRRRRLLETLVQTLEAGSGDADRIAVARWKLDLERPVEPPELVALAALVATTDKVLAERFLRVAVATGDSTPAWLALANFLTHHHKVSEAEAIFSGLARRSLDPDERLLLAEIRAFHLAMPANRPVEALRLVDDTLREFGATPSLLATKATALWRNGQIDRSMAAAAEVIDRGEGPVHAIVNAALTLCSAGMYGGRGAESAPVLDRLETMALEAARVFPEAPEAARLVVTGSRVLPFGDLDEAHALVSAGYLRMLQSGRHGERSQFALMMGWNRVLAGDVQTGLARLQESDAGSGTWTATTRPWIRSSLVRTLVHAGRVDEARALLEETLSMPVAGLYAIDLAMAAAAVTAAGGARGGAAGAAAPQADADAAVRILKSAIADLERWGHRQRLLEARYQLVQLGDTSEAVALADSLARRPNAQTRALRHHVLAVVEHDPVAIERAAAELEAAGLLLFAAHAQGSAVPLYHDAGHELGPDPSRHRETLFAVERRGRLVRACPGLDDALVPGRVAAVLTARESEVAFLAASGLPDSAIAARLQISVRTVNVHLGKVYGKLAVRGRRELSGRLRNRA